MQFTSCLVEPEQIALQAPILRRIYNESTRARAAIDVLATLMSQGMVTAGGGNAEIAGFVRDYLDLGLSRTYLAHVVRDAFVCGNGYLSWGQVPDEDIRLLRPESVAIQGDGTFIERTPEGDVLHRRVLHVKGASQADSPYGISILEPLVLLQIQKETADELKARAAAWNVDAVPVEHREYALSMLPFAERTLETVETQTKNILGPVLDRNTLDVQVPAGLYFAGAEKMQPAAQAIAMPAASNEVS
ncbi:hypothetical protein MKUB_14530 [Mycobacterium kubicae]|uniref:Uncharacterized protein n=1 Tax=Mycobacterium kubicae TaxID=120959 RepID=A0AAX1JFY0_9MYCO|nr:hypothetical protein [Mycobacterium kubicae]MCV7095804.1 hypothetical protein [Mycobacterium kubicae]ORV99654.1 hypothetical protein AWC13_09650 [Mycobacterium kubicae]QNI11172.1 hypothetical protein GAN18_08105 [Mycobacterium kubicae]QPI39386.1 hypothetical protein I2456_07970 [Mycobacterium kubicae]GFG63963.1 hypothetical protein MKUB_14530 [Mycobacterium kubicae]